VQVKYKRYEKLAFFKQYLVVAYSKMVRDTVRVAMEDE